MQKTPITNSWGHALEEQFAAPYMKKLSMFLKERTKAGAVIYPPMSEMFSALNAAPLEDVKVVILGQDPYHGPGQAHGLSFSVKPGIAIPPSLRNIYKELEGDLGINPPAHGNLTAWADQGVLLLNTLLTVEQGTPMSHKNNGWETFTDAVVETVNRSENPTVFILWGAHAQKKGKSINRDKHLVIESVHPSPLSASRGFFGTKPFSRANAFLVENGRDPIDWNNA